MFQENGGHNSVLRGQRLAKVAAPITRKLEIGWIDGIFGL
jgi:hypothetical protein